MTCPVVGIGASAGGLEALEHFFRGMPAPGGVAFLVLQHLDPTAPSLLPTLLQRFTTLPVCEIVDGMSLVADQVHVVPPHHEVRVTDGRLRLTRSTEQPGPRLPIDHLFRSLADALQARGVGVVLSGMGADGTLGLAAIRDHGGAGFVQDPATASSEAMPRSAIAAGVADVVAPPGELGRRILEHLRQPAVIEGRGEAITPQDEEDLADALALVRRQTGHDFSQYKPSTIVRRIRRRMGLLHLATIGEYARHLQGHPREADLLFNEVLIGVTSFFRDPAMWRQLAEEVLPDLIAARPDGGVLRAWVAGCSTGEEAYSLAMTFCEVVEAMAPPREVRLQIFATDLARDAIDRARSGTFPPSACAEMRPERRERFFVEDDSACRVTHEIRSMVVFAPQNMLVDPPFTSLDLLTCRNLLIYLSPEVQRRLMPLFHYSLKPGGVLVLGTSESVGPAGDLFEPLPGQHRLFRRLAGSTDTTQLAFRTHFDDWTRPASLVGPGAASPPVRPQELVDRLLLRNYAPAAVLIGPDGDLLHVHGQTGRYLEPASGTPSLNLFAMARPGLAPALGDGVHRARQRQEVVLLEEIMMEVPEGQLRVAVVIHPVDEPGVPPGTLLVLFRDQPGAILPTPSDPRLVMEARTGSAEALVREVELAREQAHAARRDRLASQEALSAVNQRLQSTNEELQSTNEELTTSQEEGQSMNDELQAVNQQLQAKIDALSLASNDMANLLDSTRIATLFLDGALVVRRFTPAVADIIALRPGDVGRPVTEITSGLDVRRLVATGREVLHTLVPFEGEMAAAGDRWFSVRILPYRTENDGIDGLVLTFTDITAAKALEAELRSAHADVTAELRAQPPPPMSSRPRDGED